MKPLFYLLIVFIGALSTKNASAQTTAADNKISESITFRDMPKGPSVYGIFEGRSPCDAGIRRQIGGEVLAGLDHLKWQLILFQDSVTRQPTTYMLRNEMFERKPLTGKWRVVKDINNILSASVIILEHEQPDKPLYLLKGDENVLFILDDHFGFLTGDQDFSYTLNRVRKVLRAPPQ